ncbi:MAG TPA: hypothetical protein DDX71_06190 [Ruminococcus sp.]|nr:hypothetical protein [Ruminococcus sp.]
MTKEWHWKSKSGRAYFHAGAGMQDAVGAEKPSDAIPLQEGVRLLAAKGIDRLWHTAIVIAVLRLISRPLRRNRKKRH